MAKATVKSAEVEVRQYAGPGTFTIMNDLKGELHAKKGDWLIGTEKGKIDVISDTEFKAKYDFETDPADVQEPATPSPVKLVNPVAGAQPAAGIIAPTASATAASAPTPGFVDDSKVPLSGKVTPIQTSAGSGAEETLTVKADASVNLEKGGTLPVSELFPGAILQGNWIVEHVTASGDESILTIRKQ